MTAELHNVLEVKMRRIESDANDLLRYGYSKVRIERILADIAELRCARDRALQSETDSPSPVEPWDRFNPAP